MSATVHASAVLVGARAVLIRGPSGAGKSRLVLDLIAAADIGRTDFDHTGFGHAAFARIAFARLVGDDRVHLERAGGRLLVRPAATLQGLIELRGTGILRLPYEPCAVVGLIVDLDAVAAERLPEQRQVEVEGIKIPWLAVAPGAAALPSLLARRSFQAPR